MENHNRSKGIELADVFRTYGQAYQENHQLSVKAVKVMKHIENCRTAWFGGHKEICNECGYTHISYNSCGDRNCPKCGMLAKEKWLEQRQAELLPVPYYHIVFTISDLLNDLALHHPKIFYKLFFKSVKETLIKLGGDQKHLGAEIGFIAILHTWGQNLSFHPHLHCIVPGGGLSADGGKWLYPKKSKRKKKFFVHVNIISDLFKKIFLSRLKHGFSELKQGTLINTLYRKKWVVYCKRPFGGPQQVLDYVARYTHRTAISNDRILKMEDGRVHFKWRDYSDANKTKIMELPANEFIHRFILHVLPAGFFRIRYFGFLCSRFKKEKLKQCSAVLKTEIKSKPNQEQKMSWQEILLNLTGQDVLLCPQCKKGKMCFTELIRPVRKAPT